MPDILSEEQLVVEPGGLIPVKKPLSPEPEFLSTDEGPSGHIPSGSLIPAKTPIEEYGADTPVPYRLRLPETGLLNVSPKVINTLMRLSGGGFPQDIRQSKQVPGGSDLGMGLAEVVSGAINWMSSPRGLTEIAASSVPGLRAPMAAKWMYDSIGMADEGTTKIAEGVAEGSLIKVEQGAGETALAVLGAKGAHHTFKKSSIHEEVVGKHAETGAIFPDARNEKIKAQKQFYAEAPVALRDKEISKLNPETPIDSRQLVNRLNTLVHKGEMDTYKAAGLDQFIEKNPKVTPKVMADWMEQNEPKVEVKEIPAQYEIPQEHHEVAKEIAKLTHELENSGLRYVDGGGGYRRLVDTETNRYLDTGLGKVPDENTAAITKRLDELHKINKNFEKLKENNESATVNYEELNPKELSKMPDAVDLLVRVPLKSAKGNLVERGFKYKSHHYETEGNNLLAHVRGHIETLPSGEKVFLINELQSDWAQDLRRMREEYSSDPESKQVVDDMDHPLLAQYDRLALKAAVEYARKKGATKIAISDSKTVMMTEKHDIGYRHMFKRFDTKELAALEAKENGGTVSKEDGKYVVKIPNTVFDARGGTAELAKKGYKLDRQEGMELHYDQRLPKTAEELTGAKGEDASFGLHQSKEANSMMLDEADYVFSNPDGTPKGDITAKVFPIDSVREKFSLFNADKPAKGMQLQAAVDKNKEGGFLGLGKNRVPRITRPVAGDKLIPDYQDKDVANKQHSTLFGIDKVPIVGKGQELWGKQLPTMFGSKGAKVKTAADAPVAAWFAENYSVGPALASIFGEQIRGEITPHFPVNKDGRIEGLKGHPTPKRFIQNMMRDTNAYKLTPEQRAAFNNIIKPAAEQLRNLLGTYGVKVKKNPYLLDNGKGDVEQTLVAATEKMYTKVALRRFLDDPLTLGTGAKGVVNAELMARGEKVLRGIGTFNSFVKAMRLGYDFGVGQIQLLPTLYSHPVIWGKSQKLAMQGFFSEHYFTAYARNNISVIQEMAKQGISVGRMEEYRSGLGAQGALTKALDKLPLIGKPAAGVTRAFGRQFQISLDVAKVELWKSFKDAGMTKTAEGAQRTARLIDALTLSSRMEGNMVSYRRAIIERAALNAPSYYRGAVELMGGLIENGKQGKEARASMGKFITGSVATFVGIGYALDMDSETIMSRLNPSNSMFMTWTTDDEDGQKLNVSFGNVFKSYARLFGAVAEVVKEGNVKDLGSGSTDKNPIARWARGHAGPLPAAAWDLGTDRNYLGLKQDIGNMFAGGGSGKVTGIPVVDKSIEAVTPTGLQPGQTGKERALQMFGANAWKGRGPTAAEVAKKLYGESDVNKLSTQQRVKVQREVGKQAVPKTLGERELSSQRAHDSQWERLDRLETKLPSTAKEYMQQHKVNIPVFDEGKSVHGTMVPLSKEEREKFETTLATGYAEAINELEKSKRLDVVRPEKKQEVFSRVLGKKRQAAMNEILRSRPKSVSK